MAKRFTDTSKWKDSWYQDLPTKYKLFWVYLLDECDASGVWKPNIRLASFQIGEPFEESELKRIFSGRITMTEAGYWFIKKFIEFQYGELSANCKPHQSVINLLKIHNIKEYTKGIQTLKEKEKDKEEDQEKEKDKYIMVGKEKIFDVLPILELREYALNTREKEHSLLAWRGCVDKWFDSNVGLSFADEQNVFNSFSKFHITFCKTEQRNGNGSVNGISFEEMERRKQIAKTL